MPFAGLFLTSLLPPGFSPPVNLVWEAQGSPSQKVGPESVSQAPQLEWMDTHSFYLPVSQGALGMWQSLLGSPALMLCLSWPVCNL